MKPADVKSNTYMDLSKEINDEDPKFKIGDIIIISKYNNIFAKGYVLSWSEEFFVITKAKNTVSRTYVISDLVNEEIVGTFSEKELQKTSQKEFRVEKVIKGKCSILYIKWKGYGNSFNSWIYKNEL